MDICVLSRPGLSSMGLPWIFVYNSVSTNAFLSLWVNIEEWLGHLEGACFFFKKLRNFSNSHTILFSHQQCVLPHRCQCLVWCLFNFSYPYRYIIMFVICISLKTKSAEYLSICLFAIPISSLVKYLVKYFYHFF